jgi:hypothetical protein
MQSSDIQEIVGVERQRHFIRAMCKSIDGRSVTPSERTLLDAILEALLRGEDVSGLIGIKVAHARRPSDPMRIALHYLCLTKFMHRKAVMAWRIVGNAWGLKRREVQWIIADNWAPALAILPHFADAPDTLLRLCERHAGGVRSERRRSGFELPTRSVSDARDTTTSPA